MFWVLKEHPEQTKGVDMQATATIERTKTVAVDTTDEYVTATAQERAEQKILRWYRLSNFLPSVEWRVFDAATDALIYLQERGIGAFVDYRLPEGASETAKFVWPQLQKLAVQALYLTGESWPGDAYVNAERSCICECPEDNPQGCYRTCKCRCEMCD